MLQELRKFDCMHLHLHLFLAVGMMSFGNDIYSAVIETFQDRCHAENEAPDSRAFAARGLLISLNIAHTCYMCARIDHSQPLS